MKAKKTPRNSEEKYARIFSQAPLCIISVGLDGRFTEANDSFCRLLGYSESELVGRPFGEITHPDDIGGNLAAIPRLISGKLPRYTSDKRYLRKDGGYVWVTIYVAVVRDDDGKPQHFLTLVEDITERRRAEQEKKRAEAAYANAKRLESLGVMAGGIAHDFNNILTGIVGNLSIAKEMKGVSEDLLELLDGTERASEVAKSLTQQLLTFAKGGEPTKSVIEVEPLLKEAVQFVTHGSNAVCVYEIAKDVRPLHADRSQIVQVLHNLALNAQQAMPKGGVLTVSARNTRAKIVDCARGGPKDCVAVSVSDTGCGICEEQLEKIFDPYFTTKQEGRGLGLSMCRSIIQKHGGKIEVRSKPGAGTTFTFLLPAAKTRKARHPARPAARKTGTGRILIMDDEAMIAEVLTRMLKLMGYASEYVPNGDNALKAYAREMKTNRPFTAVIMDLTIQGGMGGEETIKKLTELDPKVRAIISSGDSLSPLLTDHARYGFAGVLRKPYRFRELSAVLAKVLKPG